MVETPKRLVQNLRAYQAIMGHELTVAGTPWKLAGEAADEIEQLQEAVSTLESTYRYECSQVERLRAALDFYADESNWIDKHSHIPYCDADRDMGMRAREALRGADETADGKA